MEFTATNSQMDESGNVKSSYSIDLQLIGENIFEHKLR